MSLALSERPAKTEIVSYRGVYFTIGMILYVLSNITNTRDFVPVQIAILIGASFVLISSKEIDPVVLMPFFLSMDIRWSLVIALIIMVKIVIHRSERWKDGAALMAISSFIIFVEALTVGGDIRYNIVRAVAMTVPTILLFYICNNRVGDSERDQRYILSIYFTSIILSVICKRLYFPDLRLSIFNGTENIAFVIISILFLAASVNVKSLIRVSLLALSYLIYIVTLESRTAAVMAVLVSGFVVGVRVNKIILSFVIIVSCYLLYQFVIHSDDLGRTLAQARYILSNASFDTFLPVLASVDVRGSLYMDAVNLISQSPIFGNGSVQPTAFPIDIYGLQEFHNGVLDTLVTFGFVGLACRIALIYAGLRQLPWRNYMVWFAVAFLAATSMVQPILFNLQTMMVFVLVLYLVSLRKTPAS